MKHMLLLLFLLLSLLLAGCSQQQEPPLTPIAEFQWPASDTQIHTYQEYPLTETANTYADIHPNLHFSHVFLDDVSLYEISPVTGSNAPLIIFLHEQGALKDEYLELACNCAQCGYFCVLMDLPGHGERTSSQAIEAIEAITQGSTDIDLLLDYYRLSHFADSHNFALLGVSMGGSVAYHYAVFGKQTPSVLLVSSATADFVDLHDKGSIIQGKEHSPTWDKETFLSYCSTRNPINHLDRLRQMPIVAMYGLQDTIVNIQKIHTLADNLSASGNAHFMFIDQADHEVTQYLFPYVTSTLNQFLK